MAPGIIHLILVLYLGLNLYKMINPINIRKNNPIDRNKYLSASLVVSVQLTFVSKCSKATFIVRAINR